MRTFTLSPFARLVVTSSLFALVSVMTPAASAATSADPVALATNVTSTERMVAIGVDGIYRFETSAPCSLAKCSNSLIGSLKLADLTGKNVTVACVAECRISGTSVKFGGLQPSVFAANLKAGTYKLQAKASRAFSMKVQQAQILPSISSSTTVDLPAISTANPVALMLDAPASTSLSVGLPVGANPQLRATLLAFDRSHNMSESFHPIISGRRFILLDGLSATPIATTLRLELRTIRKAALAEKIVLTASSASATHTDVNFQPFTMNNTKGVPVALIGSPAKLRLHLLVRKSSGYSWQLLQQGAKLPSGNQTIAIEFNPSSAASMETSVVTPKLLNLTATTTSWTGPLADGTPLAISFPTAGFRSISTSATFTPQTREAEILFDGFLTSTEITSLRPFTVARMITSADGKTGLVYLTYAGSAVTINVSLAK